MLGKIYPQIKRKFSPTKRLSPQEQQPYPRLNKLWQKSVRDVSWLCNHCRGSFLASNLSGQFPGFAIFGRTVSWRQIYPGSFLALQCLPEQFPGIKFIRAVSLLCNVCPSSFLASNLSEHFPCFAIFAWAVS